MEAEDCFAITNNEVQLLTVFPQVLHLTAKHIVVVVVVGEVER